MVMLGLRAERARESKYHPTVISPCSYPAEPFVGSGDSALLSSVTYCRDNYGLISHDSAGRVATAQLSRMGQNIYLSYLGSKSGT
jgi:hypothetical protein